MPVFEKRRFQHGAVDKASFDDVFPTDELAYRTAHAEIFGAAR
jgi:asparagine synthase (glutamine-hydrolysing)